MWSTSFLELEWSTPSGIAEVTPVWRALRGSGLGKASKGGSGGGAPKDEDDNMGLIIGLSFAISAIILSLLIFLWRRTNGSIAIAPDQYSRSNQSVASSSKSPEAEHVAAIKIQRKWRSRSGSDLEETQEKGRKNQQTAAETPSTVATAARSTRRKSNRPACGRYGQDSSTSNSGGSLREAAAGDDLYSSNDAPSPTLLASKHVSNNQDPSATKGRRGKDHVQPKGKRSAIDGYLQKHDDTVKKQVHKKTGKKK